MYVCFNAIFYLVSLMQKLGMYFVDFIVTSGGQCNWLTKSVDQTIHISWMQNPDIIIYTKDLV